MAKSTEDKELEQAQKSPYNIGNVYGDFLGRENRLNEQLNSQRQKDNQRLQSNLENRRQGTQTPSAGQTDSQQTDTQQQTGTNQTTTPQQTTTNQQTAANQQAKQAALQQGSQLVQSIMGSYGYTPGSAVTQAQEKLNAYESQRPEAYSSRWQDQMDSILNDILNQKEFSYDVNADPLFQQYRDQYTRNGKMAMQDSMGQAAQLTGGYGNSYAQQAGQQAYGNYMQGLNDKIPELYNLALEAYNNRQNQLLSRYNLMGTQEDREYGRYQDDLNAYNTELSRLQDLFNTERSYDYGQYRDTVSDAQQKWTNAWAMFKAGKDTPEIREILGLPAKGSSSSKSSGGGDDGGGSSTKKKSNKTSVFEQVASNVASGNNAAATRAVASAGNAITSSEKEQMLRYIQGNSKRK